MRAYQLPKGGAGIESVTRVDMPEPKPQHRQVLVKVAACSLNFRDLGIVRGTYRMPVRDNDHPAVRRRRRGGRGRLGRHPRQGRRQGRRLLLPALAGRRAGPNVQASALGGGIDGMLAEYAVLEEEGVVKIPAHLSLEEGATLPCAAVTVWHAMMEHAKLIAGQTVLLQGTGGVSIFGLQFAHAMGMQAIITSSSDDKLKRAPGRSAPTTPSTTRPRRTGRRRRWSSPAAAASIRSSRSAAPAPSRARSAPSASAARSA